MLMFTLAISCLTISNFSWFMDPIFQGSHTSTTECHFRFDPASSFFLELLLCSSPVALGILDTCWPGGLIFQCHMCLPFLLFIGFSRQEYWSGLPFPSPGGNKGWDGWMASLSQCTWVRQTPGDSEGQGSLACCNPRGRKESDTP